MKNKDSQRSKVYEAEHLVRTMFDRADQRGLRTVDMLGSTLTLPVERKFASLDSVQTYVDAVLHDTAGEPYVKQPMGFRAGQVVLNISLRDIAPQLLLEANNLCDDIEHCMKANTSPHLTEQLTGSRAFMNGTLAGLIRGEVGLDPAKPSIFSPFGLGVLDLALSKFIVDTALAESRGVGIESFFGETLRWN